MDALQLKQLVAQAALKYVEPNTVLGVGTGSTVDCFLDALAAAGIPLKGAVSSSVRSEKKLREMGVPIVDMNDVTELSVYIDGADEIDPAFHLVKGGGGALTREKIVADISRQFVCIADASKMVGVLGKFPLPVEVLPMSREAVARKLTALGGQVKERAGFVTDNGNLILDVSGLAITDPVAMEQQINQWPGVVTNGLFALRKADVVLLGTPNGVETRS
ncbi:MAG: ribose-5-phosphate isomerase RpiA [Limnobacter sp.]|uniref:ribose-5-phosphate isomerase RpiA n=1 Tax=Limnobacter sp. TaxID=2003368 RepID=UPI00391A7E02